ncbi:MAG: hypothetical protein IT374_03635 [Polyangiaceae bacterium]|nr:hypothetical protein [Polyangiaceae bacterium]
MDPRPEPRFIGALRAALSFRGTDGRGLTLGHWLLVWVAVWGAAKVLSGLDLVLSLVPPFLALSIAVPVVTRAVARSRAGGGDRFVRWTEPVVVSLAFGVLAWSVLGFTLTKRIPIDTGDHQIMIVRAELFAKSLLSGKLRYFTHAVQGGDSLVDLYPIFANLVSTAFYVVLPKSMPFPMVYTVMCIWTWWFRGVATYHLSRRFAGPLPSAFVALLMLFEVGDDVWDGVWNGMIYWGMIHNNVALSVAMFAAAAQIDLVRRHTTPRFLACVGLFALAAFAHPLGILFAVAAAASLAVSLLASQERKSRSWYALLASVLGIVLASFWVVPYTKNLRELGFRYAIPGESYKVLGAGLLRGDMPHSSFGAWIGVGVLGVFAMVTSGRVALVAGGMWALVFFLLALTPFTVQSRLVVWVPAFLDGQQRRMLTVLKCAIVPAMAYVVGHMTRHLARAGSLLPSRVVGRAILLLLVLMGPTRAVVNGFAVTNGKLVEQIPQGPRPARSHTDPDYLRAFDYLRQKRQADPSGTPWRTSIHWNRMKHAAWTEGDLTGVPVVEFIAMSAAFLGIRPREISEQGFHDWNIRYSVTDHGTAPWAGMTKVFSSGPYVVWEVPKYDDRFVVAPAGVTIKGLALVGDEIRFDVEGAPAEGADVQVRCAWFPRWKATVAGAAVPITAVPPHAGALPKQEQIGLRVKNGHVVIACTGVMPGALRGMALSAFALAGVIALGKGARRRRLGALLTSSLDRARERLGELTARVTPARLAAGAAVVLLVGYVAVGRRGTRHLLAPPLEGMGLRVSLKKASGGPVSCVSALPMGAYFCDGASVESFLGYGPAPLQGDCGEDPPQFPSMRIHLREAGSEVRLAFDKVRAPGHKVRFVYNTWGRFDAALWSGDKELWRGVIDGRNETTATLPPEVPVDLPLELRLRGGVSGAHLDIYGKGM